MLKNNIKKVIISLIAVFSVVSVACTTFATDGEDWLSQMLQGNNAVINNVTDVENIPEGENTNTNLNTNNNSNTNTNTNVNENRPATTPYTGIGDYSGLIFVAIFTVSAIYAYKKVREYNA